MWKLKQYIRKQRCFSMFTFQVYTVYSNVMLRFAMQALLQDQPSRSCILYFEICQWFGNDTDGNFFVMQWNTKRKIFSQINSFLTCDLIFLSELGYLCFIEAKFILLVPLRLLIFTLIFLPHLREMSKGLGILHSWHLILVSLNAI